MATLTQTLQYILHQKDPLLANEAKRVILKEALQAYAMDFLYNHPLYRRLNLYGGTCLHVVYELNRLSEDIDLDNGNRLALDALENDLLVHFKQSVGYTAVTARTQTGEGGIHRIVLRFPILAELGLTPHPNEALHLTV